MVAPCEAFHAFGGGWIASALPEIGQSVRLITDLLIFSSLLMGFQGLGMVYISYVLQGLTPAPAAVAIMLLVPFAVYNMNRKTDEEEDRVNHPDRFAFTKRFMKPLEYAAYTAYALAVLIAASLGVGAVLVTLVPLIAGILYSVPMLPPHLGYRRFKEIPVMKNVVVCTSWSTILVLLPCVASGTPVTVPTGLCFVFFFAYVFIASALPDMRDREGDALAGVRTIAVIIGVETTRKALTALNGITAFALIAAGVGMTLSPLVTALFAGTHCYSQCCITLFGRIGRTDMICDVFLDGGFVIIGAMIFLSQAMVQVFL